VDVETEVQDEPGNELGLGNDQRDTLVHGSIKDFVAIVADPNVEVEPTHSYHNL
tara:strand:- start:1649 stop:1810 length:162 start_codon:yes stop_codon:yes gene_type:complete